MSRTHNRTRTRVLEEMNFPSEMSNMTVRVIEKSKEDKAGDIHRDHRLEITHGSHLGYSTASFPLPSPDATQYIAKALTRAAAYMQVVGSGWEHTFKRPLDDDMVVVVRGGLQRRKVFQEEIVVSHHETYSAYVGDDWIDAEGSVSFSPAPKRDHHLAENRQGHGSYSSISAFDDHEIGMTIPDVNKARREARVNGDLDLIPHKPIRSVDVRIIPAGHGVDRNGKPVLPDAITVTTLPPQPTLANLKKAYHHACSVFGLPALKDAMEMLRERANLSFDDFTDVIAEFEAERQGVDRP